MKVTMSHSAYEPTPVDINWLRNVLQSMADGGRLGYPRSELIFRIDHSTKTMVLVHGDVRESDYEATVETAKQLGWSVRVEGKE
jgi:hypothetical protein